MFEPAEITFFELEQVIETHDIQLRDHGGGIAGIKNQSDIESALNQPRVGAFGQYLHTDIFEMAAAYLFHIANNHGFNDGNKRTALAVSIEFLGLHDIGINATNDELTQLALCTVNGSKIPTETKAMVAAFFRSRAETLLLDTDS